MAKCIFENLTVVEAKALADWYERCGQLDNREWFMVCNLKSPQTDIYHKGGSIKTRKNGDVVVYCKGYRDE